jgi:hypothetical protein
LSSFFLVPIGSGVAVIVTGRVRFFADQEPVELSPIVAWVAGAAMIALGLLFLLLLAKAMRLKFAGGQVPQAVRPRLVGWLTALLWLSLAGLFVALVLDRDWWGVATLVVIVSGFVFIERMNRVQGGAQPETPPEAPDPAPRAPAQDLDRGEPGAPVNRGRDSGSPDESPQRAAPGG